MRSSLARQRGFTLIEVLVAFAIFALSVGALFEVFAGATRRARQAEVSEMLWLTAQSVLSERRVRPAPWPEEEKGERSGTQWRVITTPYDSGAEALSPWKAFLVRVEVADSASRRNVELLSVELARIVP
ncbi:MAG: type II secretion system protein [Gammaproteobacteria bacterium]